jgi:hypothetical protein
MTRHQHLTPAIWVTAAAAVVHLQAYLSSADLAACLCWQRCWRVRDQCEVVQRVQEAHDAWDLCRVRAKRQVDVTGADGDGIAVNL